MFMMDKSTLSKKTPDWLPFKDTLYIYTVCVKRNAHLIPIFFVAPWGRGPKIHIVDCVNYFFFSWGHKKKTKKLFF